MATKRRPKRSSKKTGTSPLLIRIVLTVIVLIALGSIAYLAFFRRGTGPVHWTCQGTGPAVLVGNRRTGYCCSHNYRGQWTSGIPYSHESGRCRAV